MPTVNEDRFSGRWARKVLSLSFCGFTGAGDPMYDGFRMTVLRQLAPQPYADFILRNSWANLRAGWRVKIAPHESRRQFFSNISNNLYGLCLRGGGNFSFRLGEVLMMGRIPVLIDTDCILPFRDRIPYETNTVYVTRQKSDGFRDIDSVIRDYHESHSEADLLRIQRENRWLWEEYFTVTGAFRNIEATLVARRDAT
jgi:hypothetical protein